MRSTAGSPARTRCSQSRLLRFLTRTTAVLALALVGALAFAAPALAVSLGDAVDAPALTWETYGQSGWTGDSPVTHDGVDAARSGPVTNYSGGYSGIRTTVTGPGKIWFWVYVDSYFTHYGAFYVDGVRWDLKYYGVFPWWQTYYDIPAGTHTLSWEYHKDLSYSGSNGDCMYLDQVVWAPTGGGPTGTMSINDGAATTTSRYVNIDSSIAGATQMQFRDSGGSWSGWETYSADKPWTLPVGDGVKTVEAEYRDAYTTISRSDSITLSTSPPGTTIYVNAVTGSDTTGDGGLANPYKSVTKGLAMVSAGGIVDVAMGTYDEAATGEAINIDLKSDVTLRGHGKTSTIIQDAGGLDAFSKTGVVIEDLKVRGTTLGNAGLVLDSSSVELRNCWLDNWGYGVSAYGSTVSLTGCDISDDYTIPSSGYAGLASNNSTVTVTGGSVSSNNARGVKCIDSTLTLSGATVDYNDTAFELLGTDATITDSTASHSQRVALYVDDWTGPADAVLVRRTTMASTENTGGAYAAIVLRGGTDFTLEESTVTASVRRGIQAEGLGLCVTLKDSAITGNGYYGVECNSVGELNLDGSVVADNAGIGLAVWGMSSTGTATIDSSTIRNNADGGAFLQGRLVKVRDCIVESNDGTYGGIYAHFQNVGASFSVTDSTIRNNTRNGDGGGIACIGYETALVARTVVESNTASGHGGGIYHLSGTLTVSDSTIASNTATAVNYGRGGGIYLHDTSTAQVQDTTITANAAYRGGGVEVCGTVFNASRSVFATNTATESGGGIDLDVSNAQQVRLDNCTIRGCSAPLGGGFYNEANDASGDILRATDSTFTANTASNATGGTGRGGGLLLRYVSLEMTRCAVSDNTASEQGGGLYFRSAPATITASRFAGNVAGGDGGGMRVWSDTPISGLVMRDSELEDNDAGNEGGGIALNGSAEATLTGTTLARNTAPRFSAGFFYAQTGGILLEDCLVEDNISGTSQDSPVLSVNGYPGRTSRCVFRGNHGSRGSALFQWRGIVENCLFYNNASYGLLAGDAVISASGNDWPRDVVIRGCTIAGNDDDGIWVSPSSEVTVTGSIVWDNHAPFVGTGDCVVEYSNIEGGRPGIGNISADPKFEAPAGGLYYLDVGSPCIDSGPVSGMPAADLSNVLRPQDGDGNGAARNDMGCYETPYFALNTSAAFTTSTSVTAYQSFVGATQVRYDTGSGFGAPVGVSPTYGPLTLPSGDGTKTVTAEFTFDGGKRTLQIAREIVLDTGMPSMGGVVSASHPSQSTWYPDGSAEFEWSAADALSGIAGYSWCLDQVSATTPDGSVDGTGTEVGCAVPYDGTWWFHVRARDVAGNWSAVSHRQIKADWHAPDVSILLNDGSPTAASTAVTVVASVLDTITAPEVVLTQWSTDNGSTWSGWVPNPGQWQVTLPTGNGVKTVLVDFKDAAGNVSRASDSITLDIGTPAITGIASPTHPNSGSWYPNSFPTFTWYADGAGSAITGYSVVFDGLPSTIPDLIVDTTTPGAGYGGVPDGTWYLHVRARNAAGGWSAPVHRPVLIDCSPAITLGTNRTAVSYGGMVRFTANPYTNAGTITDRGDVYLWRLPVGSTSWIRVAAMRYDPMTRTYLADIAVKANTYYEVRFAAPPYTAATSNRPKVTSRAYLSTPALSRTTPLRNVTFRTSGYLKPRHSGITRVTIQRRVGGVWRTYKTVSATNANYLSYTRWRKSLALPRGTWRIRASHYDTSHAKTYSAWKQFSVR